MDTMEFQPKEGLTLVKATEGMEAQALEDATFEPAAFVEGIGEVQPAEALQVSLEAVVASLPLEAGSSLPVPIPRPTDEVSATPIPLPVPRPEEEVSATPITLPIPVPEDEVSATPITLPIPVSEDEVSATPITLPIPVPEEKMSDLPGPLPKPAEEVGWKSTPTDEFGAVEIPLPGTGEVEYKEAPERLDVILPEGQEPLTGVGARGNVDATKGFETELPLDIPVIDMMPGIGLGQGGTPRVIGNVPMAGGKMGGGSMIPDLGIPDMPTSGGFSSSGSGPAMRGGMGGKADPVEEAAKAAAAAIKVELSPIITTSEDQCGTAADYAVERCKFADSDPDRTGNTTITFKCVGATKNSSGKLDYYEYEIEANSYTYDIKKKSDEPDDSNPHPYTGGSMGPVLPEKDNDTGKVLPDADLDGFDGTVWKADPDSVDDSGRFYGGIFGGDKVYPDSGGARPIDPVRKTEDEAESADDAG